VREREDDMHVRHVQQLAFARGQPAVSRLRLTLRTVAIATRNGELSITCLMESPRFWGAPSLSLALRSAFVAHSSP